MSTPSTKLVKMKTYTQIKELIKSGQVEMLGGGNETMHLGIKQGGMTHVMVIHVDDVGQEWAVVDHTTPISGQAYENMKLLFEE